MRKIDELRDPNSCLNKARDHEWVFVLLERDIAAPTAVRAWISRRISSGKNKWEDEQIQDALQWCQTVEQSLQDSGKLGPYGSEGNPAETNS